MYRSFRVRNFRCFRDLTVAPLRRVNLITGVNNIGKTALLEALFIHSGTYNASVAMRVDALRGLSWAKSDLLSPLSPWDYLFYNFDSTLSAESESEDLHGERNTLRLRVLHDPVDQQKVAQFARFEPGEPSANLSSLEVVKVLELTHKDKDGQGTWYSVMDSRGIHLTPMPPLSPFPAFFLPARVRVPPAEEVQRFTDLVAGGGQDVLLEALKTLEPRLDRLIVWMEGGVPLLEGDIGLQRPVSLLLMGEGMARLASLILAMNYARKGVVLVDEIENGIHHSVMHKIWAALGEAARRFDTQIFATTHSRECVRAATEAFSTRDLDEFRLHRLERLGDGMRAVTFDRDMLRAAIDMEWEVR